MLVEMVLSDGEIVSDAETKCKAPADSALSSPTNCSLPEDENDQPVEKKNKVEGREQGERVRTEPKNKRKRLNNRKKKNRGGPKPQSGHLSIRPKRLTLLQKVICIDITNRLSLNFNFLFN